MIDNIPPEIPCIACANLVPAAAQKCTKCGSYQIGWKNQLTYFSTILGGIGLLAAATAFIVGTWTETRKIIAWRDEIRVLLFEFRSGAQSYSLSVANIGDGEIVLLGLVNYTQANKQGSSQSRHLTQIIPPGKIGITQADLDKDLESTPLSNAVAVGVHTLASCKGAMDRFIQGDSCLTLVAYSSKHPRVRQFENFYKSANNPLCVYSSEAVLSAFSTGSRQYFETEFPVSNILFVNQEPARCLLPRDG